MILRIICFHIFKLWPEMSNFCLIVLIFIDYMTIKINAFINTKSGVLTHIHALRSSLFGGSNRRTEHVIHIPSMWWINTLILCGCTPPSTYYCIIKRLRSGTGHAQAGSYHQTPANGGGS